MHYRVKSFTVYSRLKAVTLADGEDNSSHVMTLINWRLLTLTFADADGEDNSSAAAAYVCHDTNQLEVNVSNFSRW